MYVCMYACMRIYIYMYNIACEMRVTHRSSRTIPWQVIKFPWPPEFSDALRDIFAIMGVVSAAYCAEVYCSTPCSMGVMWELMAGSG